MFCHATDLSHQPPILALVRKSSSVRYGVDGAEGVAALDPVLAPDAAATFEPLDEADALFDLGEEIATLAAHIHAATQRFLVLIADFDQRRGWELDGHRSCAHWLSYRTGIDMGACRERVRTAHVLAGLPETSAAMARGELSFSAVRALTRVATAENEGDLLALARGCTIAQLERTVRSWKRVSRMEEADIDRERHERRSFSVFPDDEGMYVVKGRLPAEVGALLMRAIEAASDALYREQASEPAHAHQYESEDDAERGRAAGRRRADAVALMAECALAAGFGGGGGDGGGGDESAGGEVNRAGGGDGGAGPDEATKNAVPISGTRAERYQVVLHVDDGTLTAEGEPGQSHLEDGTHVSAETSRRLSCDSGHVIMTHDVGTGSILSVGRKTRTVSPALRRALHFRDRGCRFPGCGMRFTDAHHLRHWADGGETSLSNTILLCAHHHRLVHEGKWQVTWWGEGRPAFFDPRGGTHFEGRWQPPQLPGRPVEAMIEDNARRVEESGSSATACAARDRATAGARWNREADIPDEIYFRALKALD